MLNLRVILEMQIVEPANIMNLCKFYSAGIEQMAGRLGKFYHPLNFSGIILILKIYLEHKRYKNMLI